MTDERIHLVVLFGGQSAEHDVSRTTAAHVLAAADPSKYRITPVGISTDGGWAIASAAHAELARAAAAEEPPQFGGRVDVVGEPAPLDRIVGGDSNDGDGPTVVLPLLHGPLGEDGTVQGLLELADVAYAGAGVLASAVGMDKAMAKTVLDAHGIPQARYRAFADHQRTPSLLDEVGESLGYPCFVKPANMGSSVGVTRAADREQLESAVDVALSYDRWVVIEEAITGREIEVAVIGNDDIDVSVPGEIIPGDEFYSYDDKYVNDTSQGVIPARLSDDEADEVRELAARVYRALRCEGLARCDFFFEPDGRGFLCNEINTMPGFTPISMFPKLLIASGWTYPQIIDRLVELALERHTQRRRNTDR